MKIHRLNVLFSIYSLTAVIIIIERLLPSPLLQPYNFIRLHEINQTIIFLPITIILGLFYLQIFTKNFQTLSSRGDFYLFFLFLLGAYLFGAGEGWHEVASFTLNQYCNLKHLSGTVCLGLYFNDYYAGNLIFFIGGVMMNLALMTFSYRYPLEPFDRKNMVIMLVNSLVFALTWFAYSAFDQVVIGLIFSGLLMLISAVFLYKIVDRLSSFPYILYSALAYTLATLGAIIVRFH